MSRYKEWLQEQSDSFNKEVGTSLKLYIKQSLTLEELAELDERFINNPEGENSEQRESSTS